MTTKENVGTGTDTATTTPRPQDEKIISVDFYKCIEDFFLLNDPHDYQHFNKEMLNIFMDRVLDGDEEFDPIYVKNAIFIINEQSKFLVELKEKWERYKKLTQLKALLISICTDG